MNLNDLELPNAGDSPAPRLQIDHSTSSNTAGLKVYFTNLKDRLIKLITEADVVIGNVAWVTNNDILQALSAVKGVSIIVQKEPFLQSSSNQSFAQALTSKYATLPSLPQAVVNTLGLVTKQGTEITLGPIRCAGPVSQTTGSKVDNKFVVFCRSDKPGQQYTSITPYAVWTGSFNFTDAGCNSWENAVVIKSPRIAQAYFSYYAQILAFSEPCDWTSPDMSPEWQFNQ